MGDKRCKKTAAAAAEPAEDLRAAPNTEKSGEAAREPETVQKEKQPEVAVGPPRLQVTYPYGLNLRAGPGRGYPVLAVLPMDTEVQAAGDAAKPSDGGTWLPVETGQGSGWVDLAFLRFLTAED